MYKKTAEIIFEDNVKDNERLRVIKTLASLGYEFVVDGDYIDGTHFLLSKEIPDLTEYIKGEKNEY